MWGKKFGKLLDITPTSSNVTDFQIITNEPALWPISMLKKAVDVEAQLKNNTEFSLDHNIRCCLK